MPELIPAAAAPASVRDEGSTVVQGATALNFTGAGVVASDAGGGVATINIPGGAVGAVSWGDIGGTLSNQTDLNSALSAKAPLANPTFTGTPAAPTAAGGTNTTQIATTAFVQQEISSNKYVDGEVETYADLPTGVPPAVGSAYLVRTASGIWLINRHPAGIYVRTASAGALTDWTYAGTFPDIFSDANFSLYDDSDSTKELGFSLGGITAGQKRILTPLDKNYTVEETGHASKHAAAGTDPITISQSQVTNLTTDLAGKLSTSGTAADVNPAGTSIAAALSGKLSTSGTAADVNVSGTNIAAALGGKEPTISSGTTAQYWRGDKSWQTLNASAAGLGNVTNDAQTKAAIVPNTAPAAGQILVGNAGGTAYAPVSLSGDGSLTSTGALTLSTVNSNVGSFGSATAAVALTVDAKGRITAASSATITPAVGSISGLGTGVATALAVNVGTSGAFITNGGALGTPSSGSAANLTSFPTLNQNTTGSAASLSIAGQTGLLTFTGITSSNRAKTVRDAADTLLELGGSYTPTGTWTSMTLVTPALGTPASGTLTNCSGTAKNLTAGGDPVMFMSNFGIF